jgi:hypothetical protein
MAEISREALRQLAARGYLKEIEELTSKLADYYGHKCICEALEQKDKGTDEKTQSIENKAYKKLLYVCELSRRVNTKPILPGITGMLPDEALDCCFEFAEQMYRISKEESYKK